MSEPKDSELPSASGAKVDVVVVSYNSGKHLRACVEPLAASSRVNVIVVDNASRDGTVATIEDLKLTVVAESDNRGFAWGCNRGWRLGSAPNVLFLNPDSTIDDASLDALTDALDSGERVGIVGPRILDPDGAVARSQFRFPRVSSTFSEALYLHRLWPRAAWASETVSELSAYKHSHDVEWLSGACLLVRRQLLEQLGGLDETFFMYSEDAELCRAAWAAGYSVRFESRATAVHFGGGSGSRAELLSMRTRSRVAYVTKNSSVPVAVAHRLGFALGSVTHAIVGKDGWAGRRGNIAAIGAAFTAPSARRTRAGH